jgi:hypothetical protein
MKGMDGISELGRTVPRKMARDTGLRISLVNETTLPFTRAVRQARRA